MGVTPRAKIHQIWYVFIIKCQNNCPEIWVTDITILTLLLDYVLIGCVTKLYTKTLRFLLFHTATRGVLTEAATRGVIYEKVFFFAKFTGKDLCQSLFLNKISNLLRFPLFSFDSHTRNSKINPSTNPTKWSNTFK